MHLPEPLAHLTAFSVALRPPGMDVSRLLLATLLVCLCFLTAYSHLAPEEKPRDERNLKNNSSMNLLDFPSVSIVGELPGLWPSLWALAREKGLQGVKHSPSRYQDPLPSVRAPLCSFLRTILEESSAP